MRFATIVLTALICLNANAQNIERVNIADNELNCRQIHDELGVMDKAIAEAKQVQSSSETTATAGQVGGVAAEVASRTGLFGQVGGLLGHIAGTVASKTAANVTEHTGKQGAQQGAEREKQALARKEHLTSIFLAKGCKSSDPDFNPASQQTGLRPAAAAMRTAGAAEAAAQSPSSPDIVSLPDLNPAEWFDGKMGGTFGEKTVNAFGRSNRVVIAGFRVVFVTHNETHAITRGTYMPGGRETGTAKAKMEVDLQGVDDATLQTITNAAYQRFVDQLKAAGKEVLSIEHTKSLYAGFQTSPVPQEVNREALRGRAFSPAGLPLWWQVGDPWGDSGLSQTNMRAFNELSKATDAIAIAPGIVIDFARMQSSGNSSGWGSSSASVGAKLAMSVSSFSTRVVRAEEIRYGGIVFKGDDGSLNMLNRIDTEAQFADLQQVEESDKGSVISLLGALGAKSRQSVMLAKTTNSAYASAANAVLNQSTRTFAKLLAANPSEKR